MKAKNGNEKIFSMKIRKLRDDFLVQQKVHKSIPSYDDLLASKGYNHRMLLTFSIGQ
jgi:hypothetical protein